MEFLLSVLLLAMLVLAGLVWRLSVRLAAVERRLAGGAAAPAPGAQAAPAPSTRPAPTLTALFEQLIGGRLLIWVGGVALVVAAVFLIRYSIEIGLITPALRMIAAAVFGFALLALGEWAHGAPIMADDRRIPQALVGAGLAVLYATVYGSYVLFGFLGLTTASVLMVAITIAALGLSIRHGAGTAALGLVGGFLTPWLVGDPDAGALPLLAYLALLDAAVFAIAWRRRWAWIAAVALLASFAWTGFLLTRPPEDALAGGWFALALAVLAAVLRPRGPALSWLQPLAIAGIELAILTARTDIGPVGWVAFAGIGVAAMLIARLRGEEPYEALLILVLGLMLLPLRRWYGDEWLTVAAAAMTLWFGGAALALALGRRSIPWTLLASAGFAAPVIVLRWVAPSLAGESAWGWLQAALAAGPLVLVVAGRSSSAAIDPRGLIPALAAATLLALGAVDLVPEDGLSIAWLVLSILLIVGGMAIRDRALRIAGLILLTLTVLKLFLIDAAALEGVLRILSFFGLGASLIVLGRFYGGLLRAERAAG